MGDEPCFYCGGTRQVEVPTEDGSTEMVLCLECTHEDLTDELDPEV